MRARKVRQKKRMRSCRKEERKQGSTDGGEVEVNGVRERNETK